MFHKGCHLLGINKVIEFLLRIKQQIWNEGILCILCMQTEMVVD